MIRDDAVSPVVAFMLILMILVSVIALFNSTYIPGLKQKSEIEHIQSVEESFGILSSDIDRMITFGQTGSVTDRIQMGGGDVLFSPVRSSGTLRVNNSSPDWVLELLAANSTFSSTIRVSLVNISYKPIGNFWLDQGYEWQDGIINVTKGRNGAGHIRTTWYEQNTQSEADLATTNFLTGLVRIDEVYHEKANITRLDLTAVTFSPELRKLFESGNGMGTIRLLLKGESFVISNCSDITLRVNEDLPDRDAVLAKYYDIFNNSLSRYSTYLMTRNTDEILISKTVLAEPAEVRISSRTIEIGVE